MEKWFDTEIGRNILQAKYYHAGETEPHEFIERVAGIFSPEVREKMRAYLEDGALSRHRREHQRPAP